MEMCENVGKWVCGCGKKVGKCWEIREAGAVGEAGEAGENG